VKGEGGEEGGETEEGGPLKRGGRFLFLLFLQERKRGETITLMEKALRPSRAAFLRLRKKKEGKKKPA